MKACTASQALSSQGTLSAKNSTSSMKPLTISTSGCCSTARPGGSGIQPSTPIMPTRNTTAYNRKPLAQPSAAASANRLGMSSCAVARAAPSATLRAALGWASGFRLYAVVFLVGMMGVLGWMPLPPGLAMLQHPVVLMVSGFMLMVEFFADKVPWLDSAWDAVHAFIRVPAGAALAFGVFGADNATMAIAAGLLGGSLSATALATKMTTRAAVNTSPEPFSNWGLSFFEDGLVVAVVWLATQYPVAFGIALVVMVIVSVLLLVVLFKFLRAVVRRLSSFFSGSAKVA